jgi:hypothetical protein
LTVPRRANQVFEVAVLEHLEHGLYVHVRAESNDERPVAGSFRMQIILIRVVAEIPRVLADRAVLLAKRTVRARAVVTRGAIHIAVIGNPEVSDRADVTQQVLSFGDVGWVCFRVSV